MPQQILDITGRHTVTERQPDHRITDRDVAIPRAVLCDERVAGPIAWERTAGRCGVWRARFAVRAEESDPEWRRVRLCVWQDHVCVVVVVGG